MLSLCSGDGRDLIPVMAAQPPAARPRVILVELDPVLATAGREQIQAFGLAGEVINGDAGRPDAWRSAVPVDLLMLCGIFGNITEDDIRTTIAAVPAMVTTGGVVIWTRGAFDDYDLRPQVRSWFHEAGMEELAYDGEPERYGVGVNRRIATAAVSPLPPRLFTFLR